MRTLNGRYQLLELIGLGGMAPVWRAYDEVLDRVVAVKLLTAEHAADPQEFERARNEARSAACLAHPNVAAVYDFGTTRGGGRGTAYVVMELVEGPLLSDYLRDGPLKWRFAARVGAEISAGLAAAHSQGIVHRDLKPANIVLTPAGAKILDFGIAARVGDPDLLEDGTVVGTSAYMAPERLDGARVAPALDLYAFGVVLFRCLAGELPWHAQTPEEMLEAHRSRPPASLPFIDELPPEVARICADCLSKAPAERPTAVAAALLLAASADTQVYVPTLLRAPAGPPAPRPGDRVDAPTERRPEAAAR